MALPVALIVLLILLMLTTAVVTATVGENSAGRRDTSEKRAFESAQTGLQVSLYRLNMLLNSSATNPSTLQVQCAGADSSGSNYVVENPSISNTYCAPYTQSLGNGAFFTSWTSVAFVGSSGTCAGVTVGANSQVTERCIVSQGIVCPVSYTTATCPNPVVHRVEERAAAFTGKPVFPLSGVFGLNGVLLKNSAQLVSINGSPVVATNKQLALQNSANASGPALLPRGAGTPIIQNTAVLGTSPQCSKATSSPFPTNCVQTAPSVFVASQVLPPPVTQDSNGNYLSPDGDVRIDNAFKTSCLNTTGCPHDTFTGCGTPPTASACGWNRSNHTLSLPNGVTWTLGGAQYNLCSFSMQGQSTLLLPAATGANGQQLKSALYIDSPSDPPGPGSVGCPSGTGFLNVTNQAQITNSAPPLPGSPLQHDTTAFELWVYGPSSDYPNGTYSSNHCITPVQSDCVQLGNKGTFYGTLYAPTSDVLVDNTGNNYGGVMGATVVYDNPGTFTQDVNVPTLVTTATLAIYYRTAWSDCSAQPASASSPASAC